MKKYLNIIFLILAAVLITGAGCSQKNNQAANSNLPVPEPEDVIMEEKGMNESDDMMKDDAMIEDNVMMEEEKKDGSMMEGGVMMDEKQSYAGAVLAGGVSKIYDFNKEDYDRALKTDNLIVLYFYANWCPICKQETTDALYPAFNDLTTDKVVGFRVNYNDPDTDDAEKDLARQFGVAYQHTKVFVLGGERVLKSPASWDKDRYLSEINKALNN